MAGLFAKTTAQLAVLAHVVGGARIARKHAPTGIQDCYSPIDGQPLLSLNLCTHDAVQEVEDHIAAGLCTLLTDERDLELPAGGVCTNTSVACGAGMADELLRRPSVNLVSADAGGFYREMSGTAKSFVEASMDKLSSQFYSDWRDLDTRMARVEAAVQSSGGAAQLEVAGKSVEGRDIKVVRFRGKGFSAGMPRLVLSFNIHAREWISGMAGVYAVEKLAARAKEDPGWLAGMEIVLVPMLNPDGFQHSTGLWRFHRKNMRVVDGVLCTTGVDLNRNNPTAWGKFGASSKCAAETFRGPSALSEPETQTMDKLFREAPMTAYFDVHAWSQLLLSAWTWTKEEHPRAAEFAEFGGKVHAAIEGKHGKTYKFGPAAQTLYVASGVIADYATTLGALGYTIELRPRTALHSLLGFTPNPREILPTAEECFEGILAAIANLRTV